MASGSVTSSQVTILLACMFMALPLVLAPLPDVTPRIIAFPGLSFLYSWKLKCRFNVRTEFHPRKAHGAISPRVEERHAAFLPCRAILRLPLHGGRTRQEHYESKILFCKHNSLELEVPAQSLGRVP